jgi:hypothetical protein
MVNFQDDPNLKDDETLLSTKSVGWLPVKEMFNVWWLHREMLREVLKTEDELTDEIKIKLQTIEKEIERQVDKFLPKF